MGSSPIGHPIFLFDAIGRRICLKNRVFSVRLREEEPTWSVSMILSVEQVKELEILSEPLMIWLRSNCHPHVDIEISSEELTVKEHVAFLSNRNTAG